MAVNAVTAKWLSIKPYLFPFAIGLVVGPLFTAYMGWQVTSSSARADIHAGIIKTHVAYCEARARIDVKEPNKLDWSARNDLAKKWASLPGTEAADSEVARGCADKLAA
jgi:hypothetical protein